MMKYRIVKSCIVDEYYDVEAESEEKAIDMLKYGNEDGVLGDSVNFIDERRRDFTYEVD